jgi:hypothetical protein
MICGRLSIKRISDDSDLQQMTAHERGTLLAFSLLVIVGFALPGGRLAVRDLWP